MEEEVEEEDEEGASLSLNACPLLVPKSTAGLVPLIRVFLTEMLAASWTAIAT